MELFHFLSGGSFEINQALQILFQNLTDIKDLILNKKFILFSPRPKLAHENTIEYIQLMHLRAIKEYPLRNGYENSRIASTQFYSKGDINISRFSNFMER